MASLSRTIRRFVNLGTLAAVPMVAAACSSLHTRGAPGVPRDSQLSQQERIAHTLSRLTFGAKAGDVERVSAMGVDRWIDAQLHPSRIADTMVVAALAPLRSFLEPL